MKEKRSLWNRYHFPVLIARLLISGRMPSWIRSSLTAPPLAQDPPLPGSRSAARSRGGWCWCWWMRCGRYLPESEVMPYLNELRQSAAWATMHSRTPSYSAPGWTTILTGAWPDINDSHPANPPNEEMCAPSPRMISLPHPRAGLQTAVSGFSGSKICWQIPGLTRVSIPCMRIIVPIRRYCRLLCPGWKIPLINWCWSIWTRSITPGIIRWTSGFPLECCRRARGCHVGGNSRCVGSTAGYPADLFRSRSDRPGWAWRA